MNESIACTVVCPIITILAMGMLTATAPAPVRVLCFLLHGEGRVGEGQ